jgi:uncharacterized protein YbaR (Trm112 family)
MGPSFIIALTVIECLRNDRTESEAIRMVLSDKDLICPYCKAAHDADLYLYEGIIPQKCRKCGKWFDVEQQISVIYITMKRED